MESRSEILQEPLWLFNRKLDVANRWKRMCGIPKTSQPYAWTVAEYLRRRWFARKFLKMAGGRTVKAIITCEEPPTGETVYALRFVDELSCHPANSVDK